MTTDSESRSGPPGGDRPGGGFGGGGFGGPRGGGGGGGRGGDAGGPRKRGRYIPRRKVCQFCVDKIHIIDYKDPGRLRRFVSDRGKIEPRRKTGTCAKHQRALSTSLKRARHLALLPFTAQHIRETGVFAGRG